jgi:hypothetical protein
MGGGVTGCERKDRTTGTPRAKEKLPHCRLRCNVLSAVTEL